MFGKSDDRKKQEAGEATVQLLRAMLALQKAEFDKRYGAGSADKTIRERGAHF